LLAYTIVFTTYTIIFTKQGTTPHHTKLVDSLWVGEGAHGIEGNEVAEKLTKEAAQDVDEQNIV